MARLEKFLVGIFAIVIIVAPAIFSINAYGETNSNLIERPVLLTKFEMIEDHFNEKIKEYQELKKDHLKYGQATIGNVDVYKENNIGSEVIENIEKGMTFEIISRHFNLLEISFNGIKGFIDVNLVEQYQEAPPIEVPNVPHYNPNNLRELSNLSEQQIYDLLEGSALQTLSKAYYYYEKLYNVNAIFLIALNSEESGHGKSYLAIAYNNLGGVKSSTGGYRYFGNWGDSLEYIASLLDEYYLTEGAIYYNGESVNGINVRYSENPDWANNLNIIANEFLEKIN